MPIESEPYTKNVNGWTVSIASPTADPDQGDQQRPRTLLLLHGLTGDENVMWIFTHNLPRNTWIFSPRAPIASEAGGYMWLSSENGWPRLFEFEEVAGRLMTAFQQWAEGTSAPVETFDVMGFSQGAAMAYALAAFYPQRVHSVIALAGFLPAEDPLPGRYATLKDKKIYVAHGSKDYVIPVGMAQEAVRTLKAAGAEVVYCESDVGHKLSAPCLRGLTEFITA